ncbi:DUF4132 domain-containing protein [Saccharothrix obliqua]|uniref:DUF4132 domain-containing protein n=1 Tax=Saccharothrix obliqua TaxID=2861747 RepID=UPI001C604C5E|nr:DUF4132 domain-containing protein [Saccharothrix obliqua]MBW4718482.1 DUF4132 domain-containing protein [Saccharothrix obliqua]
MRRWELVAATSAKFWEVDRAGAVVTVRFGRLGTGGQTKSRELPTEAAATAHVTKLIAEKERKGYAETTSGAAPAGPPSTAAGPGGTSHPAAASEPAASDPAAAPVPAAAADDRTTPGDYPTPVGEIPTAADEDVLVFPPKWRATVHPRHGGHVPSDVRPAPKAAGRLRRFLAEAKGLATTLADDRTDPALAAALDAYLAGGADAVGAACAVAMTVEQHHGSPPDQRQIADDLVLSHGVEFAARAAVELGRVEVHVGRRLSANRRWLAPSAPGRLGHRMISNLLDRVRRLIAAHPDQAGVAAAVADLRTTTLTRLIASYLVPTRTGWVDEVLDEAIAANAWADWTPLLASIGTVEQFRRVLDHDYVACNLGNTNVLRTVVDGVGPAAAPVLARLLDGEKQRDARRPLVETLAVLPTDEAFDLLLARVDQPSAESAVIDAARRFPRRALRRFAAHAGNRVVRNVLHAHVRAHGELVAELPEDVRQVVAEVEADYRQAPAADPATLPALLVRPPWTVGHDVAKPVVLKGIEAPRDTRVAWAPGEREEWLATRDTYFQLRDADWPKLVRHLQTSAHYSDHQRMSLFLHGPVEDARPLLAQWRSQYTWNAEQWGRLLAARFEADALPALLDVAKSRPAVAVGLLMPFVDGRVAHLMAGWLVRSKSARAEAITWLRRHAADAARHLVPTALGAPGAARRSAEAALRLIPAEAVAAAGAHGPAAEAAIHALTTVDPLDVLPVKLPSPGDWADPGMLPQVLLADRRHALPHEAVGHVITMLAMSTPDDVYAGVPVVRELCDPKSLAEFAWALFERWRGAGMPSKDGWALGALGLLGDDDTARLLAPLIKAWPGESGHARAVAGLDVLAAIGTDVALVQLNSIAVKAKFKGLKQRAQEKIESVAAGLGLSAEQLADRLVPDFGLDDAATLTIDYGTRRFLVGFDEQLKPHVVDDTGKRRKDLPKPGAKDDPELAPAEHKRFAQLKKDVRAIAAEQIDRLEAAMVRGRRWSATEFRELFTGHPLLWHIVRRLVWTTTDGHSFRPAEDRTLADVHDNTYTLPDNTHVGIAHPLHLGHDLPAWAELFADYEILQPFPQLGRPVHHLTTTERTAQRLTRFEDVFVPTGRILGLTQRGWQRGTPMDAGMEAWVLRPLPSGGSVVVNLDPGIAVGMVDEFPEQKLTEIWVHDEQDGAWSPRGELTFGTLDPVTASELIAELTGLTS